VETAYLDEVKDHIYWVDDSCAIKHSWVRVKIFFYETKCLISLKKYLHLLPVIHLFFIIAESSACFMVTRCCEKILPVYYTSLDLLSNQAWIGDTVLMALCQCQRHVWMKLGETWMLMWPISEWLNPIAFTDWFSSHWRDKSKATFWKGTKDKS